MVIAMQIAPYKYGFLIMPSRTIIGILCKMYILKVWTPRNTIIGFEIFTFIEMNTIERVKKRANGTNKYGFANLIQAHQLTKKAANVIKAIGQ